MFRPDGIPRLAADGTSAIAVGAWADVPSAAKHESMKLTNRYAASARLGSESSGREPSACASAQAAVTCLAACGRNRLAERHKPRDMELVITMVTLHRNDQQASQSDAFPALHPADVSLLGPTDRTFHCGAFHGGVRVLEFSVLSFQLSVAAGGWHWRLASVWARSTGKMPVPPIASGITVLETTGKNKAGLG
jgi:hypothetical protein